MGTSSYIVLYKKLYFYIKAKKRKVLSKPDIIQYLKYMNLLHYKLYSFISSDAKTQKDTFKWMKISEDIDNEQEKNIISIKP